MDHKITGDTTKALEVQKKALAMVPKEDSSDDRADFEERLAEYEAALKENED